MQNQSVTAYIALGANLGDRQANIRAALGALNDTPGTSVSRLSTLIENPAVGGPTGSPDFLNGVGLSARQNAKDTLVSSQTKCWP